MTIPRTIKAAVVAELGTPLEIREHPVLQIGTGEVLVRVRAPFSNHYFLRTVRL